MTEKEQIEKVIDIAKAGGTVKIHGIGNSMRPLLHGGRDYIYMEAIPGSRPIQKGDVVLYYSFDKYKIHRVMNITNEGYIISGDGNQFLEAPLPKESIYLRAVGFQRGSKYISAKSFGYKVYSFVWRVIFPFRPIVRKIKWILNDIGKIFGLKVGR